MYAVIFKAELATPDDDYFATAEKLRELAMADFGCVDFISVTEGSRELTISYWPSRDAIKRWHDNAEHRVAQQKGKERWYKSYQVEVAEIAEAHPEGD